MKVAVIPSHFKPFLCFCGVCNLKEMRVTNDSKNMISRGNQDSIACSSTRFTLSRLVLSLFKRSFKYCRLQCKTITGSARRRKTKQSESNDTDPLKNDKLPLSLGLENLNSPNDQTLASAAGRDMEVPSNVGLGFGLMYLIAACKNEFDKMTELRTQMEVLVQDVKNNLSRKYETTTSKPSRTNANLSFSTVNSPLVGSRCYHRTNQKDSSSEIEGISRESDRNLKYDSAEMEEELVVGIDEIKALKVEFERLQHDLKQQNIEMLVDHSGVAATTQGSASEEPMEEIHNEGDGAFNEEENQGGVSPKELERRLHELLETRQQERITELEYALECAKKRLHQKEMEASWWKDTASLISQHISESRCLSR